MLKIGYLYGLGVSLDEIERGTGVPEASLSSIFSRKRLKPPQNRIAGLKSRIGGRSMIRRAAAARGMDTIDFIEKVIKVLASDLSLLDNVMDDGIKS